MAGIQPGPPGQEASAPSIARFPLGKVSAVIMGQFSEIPSSYLAEANFFFIPSNPNKELK